MEAEIVLNQEQQQIINYIEKCISTRKICRALIQGVAGTGKSFLIKYIREILREKKLRCILGTHQAIAASVINGYTLYKLFGFYGSRDTAWVIRDGKMFEIVRTTGGRYTKNKTYSSNKIFEYKNFYYHAEDNWFIIDEISMIGLELLDDMNNVLRALFESEEPFGGINLIFSGHFSQLKPVKEIPIFKLTTDHFIKHMMLFELTINQRQTNQEFFDLCNAVMRSCLKSDQKRLLKSRLVKNFEYSTLIDLVHIFPTKKLCNDHNINRLLSLNEDIYYFLKALDVGQVKILSNEEKNIFNGLHNFVIFSKNSKIMITVNEDPFINGELYIIDNIKLISEISEKDFMADMNEDNQEFINRIKKMIIKKGKTIKYCVPNSVQISLSSVELNQSSTQNEPKTKENKIEKYNNKSSENSEDSEDSEDSEIEKKRILFSVVKTLEVVNKKRELEIIFQRTMYPFQLAWAVTTHKIQGISLNEGVIDMGEANFDPVQLYVNISRLRSLDKLYIKDLKLPLPVSPDKALIKKFLEEIKINNKNNSFYKESETNIDKSDIEDDFDFDN
jgi:hypothetical protein